MSSLGFEVQSKSDEGEILACAFYDSRISFVDDGHGRSGSRCSAARLHDEKKES
jgi:hypothetical protein